MSTGNSEMVALLKRQEAQRQELAAGSYEAWLPVKEKEDALLKPFEGKYQNAFKEVQAEINEGREKYFEEWGADGRLAALMSERQATEREKLVKQQTIMAELKRKQDRGRDDDNGR